MVFLYDFFLLLFQFGVHLASPWYRKANLWKIGRKSSLEKLASLSGVTNKNRIWIHCSSLGEFEQARPLIESIKNSHPHHFILLSFFSPSGYEVRKEYKGVDLVCYMPLDGRSRAKGFVDLVKPQVAIFIKYESWYHYLSELRTRKIPCYLVSAYFTPDQVFFKSWGGFFRNLLKGYTHIFVQDQGSHDLLKSIDARIPCSISGDTRFDQVIKTATLQFEDQRITAFCGSHPILVAGSTWPDDEKILAALANHIPHLKMIIAPHNIHAHDLQRTLSTFTDAVCLSDLQNPHRATDKRVLIIDNMGTLSKLYRLGALTYVGGGFNKAGIHNVLEAAVYSKPVFFGPNHHKSLEAGKLIKLGAAFPVCDETETLEKIGHLLLHEDARLSAGKTAGAFVRENKGATQKIMDYLSDHSARLQ